MKYYMFLTLFLISCSKKEYSKEELFVFLDRNPQYLQEYLKIQSTKNPQKRLLNLSLEEINKARGIDLPFNFSEEDMLLVGNKTIIGLETSLDCPVICKNNFKEIKSFALKNDIGVGLILTKSKNHELDKYTHTAIKLYPNQKINIIEEIINNPKNRLEDTSKKLNLDHQRILTQMKKINLDLKLSSDTPLIYINNLTIKGIYRQEAFEEVFKILF